MWHWDADGQHDWSWKTKLLKGLISGQICNFSYCSVLVGGGRALYSDVILWCHSLKTLSRQTTLSVKENMQAFIYHRVFTWTLPSFGFTQFSYFMSRLNCYMFYECLTTLTQRFLNWNCIFLWVTVTLFLRLMWALWMQYRLGFWVDDKIMMRHLKALPALMHVNQTQCPIMSLSWACMIKCIYNKLRYKDKMIHE